MIPKLPLAAAVLVHTAHGALGIGAGASLVLLAYVIAKLSGHPIEDMSYADTALALVIVSVSVWLACAVIAWIADRKRGL
jgi:hypothetical protein